MSEGGRSECGREGGTTALKGILLYKGLKI